MAYRNDWVENSKIISYIVHLVHQKLYFFFLIL